MQTVVGAGIPACTTASSRNYRLSPSIHFLKAIARSLLTMISSSQ